METTPNTVGKICEKVIKSSEVTESHVKGSSEVLFPGECVVCPFARENDQIFMTYVHGSVGHNCTVIQITKPD